MKILIIGRGYIGKRCHEAWPESVVCEEKIFEKADALRVLEKYRPEAVLNAAGVRGKPNVDWCEDHQLETVIGNTKLPIVLAEACQEKKVYLLHVGSGCIFYGDSPHPDKAWRESDFGNPKAFYSKTKYAADLALIALPDTGIARIRMPIDELPSPGNLIDKLVSFPKVIDVENSVTIIPDMVEVFRQLLEKKAEGVFHVTNPGTIRHREIIALYEKYVDSTHTNEWITNEELVNLGLAKKGRSNNFLSSENLKKAGIEIREVHEAMEDVMRKYAEARKKGNLGEAGLSC